MNNPVPASYGTSADIITGPKSQRAHRDVFTHSAMFERKFWCVRDGVWCFVGNGLSNQTFIEGPEGIIAIDTGESVEEMAAALKVLREHSQARIAAVIYTHFHYVDGTRAVEQDSAVTPLPVYGHARIPVNRARMAGEVNTAAGRGLVHQFALAMPTEGEDGLVSVGLGLEFRSADHAPFTAGHISPTHTFTGAETCHIAGLDVHVMPAPTDADDNVTLWFPSLGVCVNNAVWPALFNVFAIRGEEYRDPRQLLGGLDHILGLDAEHLVGAHGIPISGKDHIRSEVTRYRDSIQFMWDQTVRALNRGMTATEIAQTVQLPAVYETSYLTRQFYGLVEHHTRQIHAGLRGWFDGDEAALFPMPPVEKARRLIAGFGGADVVRGAIEKALEDEDLRWALELATWLVRVDTDAAGRADAGTPEDRALLATTLRAIAQRTTASNIRNWCLTRALELDGRLDLSRYRTYRFSRDQLATNGAAFSIHTLRVLLIPERVAGVDATLRFEVEDQVAGLHIRNGVAAPTRGTFAHGRAADFVLTMNSQTLRNWFNGKATMSALLESGDLKVNGDMVQLTRLLRAFELAALAA